MQGLVLDRVSGELRLLGRSLEVLLWALTIVSGEAGRLGRKGRGLLVVLVVLLLLGGLLEIGERLLLAEWTGPKACTIRTTEKRVRRRIHSAITERWKC